MLHSITTGFSLLFTCAMLMSAHSCERESKAVPPANVDAKAGDATLNCSIDADCTKVKDGCCGCNQGGKQRAIAVTAEAAWLEKLASTCGDTFCMQMISRDPSCSQRVACVQGRCELQ